MFLLLNAFVASLDGLIIGISLRLANIKLSKNNLITILSGNIIIYTFFLLLYYYFKFTFMTKTISTILYLFLAWRSYKEEQENYQKALTTLECILLACTHSLDGTIISLNFVYHYNLIQIIGIFSFLSITILLIGYYFARFFKNMKKANCISALFFVLLAIMNQFL